MQLVFVKNKHNDPLMPCSPRKARVLLKACKAKVVRRSPFTIKLTGDSASYKQEVKAGMDVGGKVIGTAAVSNGKVSYQAETTLRGEEIRKKMDQRRMYRRTRRGKKLRYRKPRFLNRDNSRKEGRLPPSVRHKIDAHAREKRFIESILPVSHWNIETTQFDIHKITNPGVSKLKGWTYQQGRQKDYYNTKAYVLVRDGYKCQYGKGKCTDSLHVHHIVFRSNGGTDKPENLVTLCERHHKEFHDGKLGDFLKLEKLLSKKAQNKVKYATHANTVSAYIRTRWKFDETYGYETKYKRERLGLPKTHHYDAVAICLEDTETAEFSNAVYIKRCVSKGDYQQTKGSRSEKRMPTGKLFGLRKFDLVHTGKGVGFVKGKRSSGFFAISDINGRAINNSVNIKKNTTRISARKSVIIQKMALA